VNISSSNNIPHLAHAVLEKYRALGLKIATVESCTGGLLMAALTDVAGASSVIECGFMVYANRAKTALVGVSEALLIAHGAVSSEVSIAMAEGGLKYSEADVCVSVTGIAGPDGGTAQKPVGLVHLACAKRTNTPNSFETSHQMHLFGSQTRTQIRASAVENALKMLLEI
jgi:nicotinamide-nucleotide amidase